MKTRSYSGGEVVAPAAESAGCYPKYIFSGCNLSIHLIGNQGTIAYSIGSQRYLARLERYMHPINPPKRDMYFFAHCSDPSTSQWAIGVEPDCEGRFPVWRQTRGGWKFVEYCHRSAVN